MGEMNQPPPPPVAVPPPMMMQPMMNPPVGVGAIHPPHEQFHHLAYCVHSNPSWVQVAALAFLHYLVMLGSTVMLASTIVPAMGGTAGDKARVIQSFLFMSGINTLLQTLIGTRLPTIMNASFAFVVPVLSIARDFDPNDFGSTHQRFVHTMRATQGALIVASILNMILGYSTIRRLSVVCVVGLRLIGLGFPQVGKCMEIGLPMLILAVVVQQYVPHYFRHFPTWLDDIGGLKSVGSEFYRKDASSRGYHVLMQLEFSDMLEWAEWFGVEDGEFCSLQTLNISSCHKLKIVPSVVSSSLASLEIIYLFAGMMQAEELSQAYASGEVFVMPSKSETLDQVVLESMSSGVPVVAACVGGIPNIIPVDQEGRTSFLFTPGNLDDWAGKIQLFLTNKEFRDNKNLSTKGHRTSGLQSGSSNKLKLKTATPKAMEKDMIIAKGAGLVSEKPKSASPNCVGNDLRRQVESCNASKGNNSGIVSFTFSSPMKVVSTSFPSDNTKGAISVVLGSPTGTCPKRHSRRDCPNIFSQSELVFKEVLQGTSSLQAEGSVSYNRDELKSREIPGGRVTSSLSEKMSAFPVIEKSSSD